MQLTKEKIEELKSKYGEVYRVNLNGQDYVYRPLRRVEYKQIINSSEANRTFSEEQIVSKCLVFPEMDSVDLSAEKAGTVSTITELIMVASNFGIQEEPERL